MTWRDKLLASDRQAVLELVSSTGFFSEDEQRIAVELVDEALVHGAASGYEFIFADAPGDEAGLHGYACFGPIPARPGEFDLYWIAVSPQYQRHGLGRELIAEAERRMQAQGAASIFIDTSGREQYRPTRGFYERAGYDVHELVRDFYAPGDDKVVYRKMVGAAPGSGCRCSSQPAQP
ncbi:MAG: GNAT family N-acetyltransferase [Woeseia sp.]